jgi:hypothetical protein
VTVTTTCSRVFHNNTTDETCLDVPDWCSCLSGSCVFLCWFDAGGLMSVWNVRMLFSELSLL